MKELLIYIFQILLPVPLLVIAARMNWDWTFFICLLLYVLAYRTLIDGHRLIKKGLIKRGEQWKLLIPGWHIKFFKELYFK